MSALEGRWPARLAAHTALRDRLLDRYAAPDRGYHDTRHLREVLDRVEELLARPETATVDRDAVVLAAWFHDAVYDGAADDEERSAALAESTLAACGVPAGLVDEVARLVRLTRDHRPEPDDLPGQVLCDADLAILASGRQRYDEYVRDVRREYAHLDDETFRAGRASVLRALLDKPTLFHMPQARDSWEATARANVEHELDGLTEQEAL
ncbi:MAG TPA: hypothetical protein VLB29_06875 [Nocardioidaceae bacterium]|nr:hypothetical protein [Nocardioidaceae bacterium]